jgi:hypothetical protein
MNTITCHTHDDFHAALAGLGGFDHSLSTWSGQTHLDDAFDAAGFEVDVILAGPGARGAAYLEFSRPAFFGVDEWVLGGAHADFRRALGGDRRGRRRELHDVSEWMGLGV